MRGEYPQDPSMNFDIHKVGGILVRDKKLLICRPRGKTYFIAPGGKIEAGESVEECLKRELMEELGIAFERMELFGVFYAPAVGAEDKMLRMDVYLVPEWSGEPTASREIEELAWVDSEQTSNMEIGSIFAHDVIPRLNKEQYIS